jgi:hypothetical protein
LIRALALGTIFKKSIEHLLLVVPLVVWGPAADWLDPFLSMVVL